LPGIELEQKSNMVIDTQRARRGLLVCLILLVLGSCYNFNNPAELGDLVGDDGNSADRTNGQNDDNGDPNSDHQASSLDLSSGLTFEGVPLGTSANEAGMSVPGGSAGEPLVAAGPLSSDNRVLAFTSQAGGPLTAEAELASPISGRFELFFDLVTAGAGAAALEVRVLDAGGQPAVALFVEEDGDIDYVSDGTTESIAGIEIEPSTLYSLRVVGQTSSNKLDIYINETLWVQNESLANTSITSVMSVRVSAEPGSNGTSYIDNLKLALSP
jgi:hypothetical protein